MATENALPSPPTLSPSIGDDDPMSITLSVIPTIGKLFEEGSLHAQTKTRYSANAPLLQRVSLFQGDITRLEIDCIVNAANKSLLGGGGVDGAIHSSAGPKLLEECRGLNGCETGQSKITRGYNLPARHVIHTVGPVYSPLLAEERAAQLASCYRTSLELAVDNALRHIAFPSVSTGIYGYPIEDATHIALDEVRRFCDSEIGSKLERVVFVVWSDKDKGVYQQLIPEYFSPKEALEAQEQAGDSEGLI